MNWDPAAARTATKTCLAFGLAMAVALYLNWPVLSVAITVQMLQNALLGIAVRNSIFRFLAACLAGFISLILLGLFPQDRFALVLAYGLVSAFAVYMFQGSKNPYFWLIVTFAVPLIGMASGGHPIDTFHQAVSTTSGFMLGGAAVILVNALLWPNPVTRVFEDAFAKTLHGLQQHFDLRRRALIDGDASHAADEQKLQAKLLESTAMLPTLVSNAAVETRQIRKFSDNYLRLMDDVTVMGAEAITLGDLLAPCLASETLRLRLAGSLAFKEGLGRFVAELGALAEQVRAERDGSLRIDAVPSPDLAAGLDLTALGDGDRALVEALRRKARDVWSAIGAVRQALANVENPQASPVAILEPPKKEPFSFSSFRFRWSVLVGLASFLGAYLWLIPQWPDGLKIAIQVPVLGITMIHQWPGQQRAIFTGVGLSIGISWVLYFFVLPPLPNDFWLLWPTMMLFLFPLVYLQALKNQFWAQAGFFGGLVFCMLVNVSHFQQYSFSSFINTVTGLVAAFGFGVAFFTMVRRKPPEQEFTVAVGDFFGLCESILRDFEDLANQPDAIRTLRTRRRALTAAWKNCASLAQRLPYSRVPQNDPHKVGEFMEALWSITLRLDAMIRERIRYVADRSPVAHEGAELRRSLTEALTALRNAAQRSEAEHELLPDFTSRPEFTEALQVLHATAESDRGSPDAAGARLALAGLHSSLLEAVQTARQRSNLLDWKAWSFERF